MLLPTRVKTSGDNLYILADYSGFTNNLSLEGVGGIDCCKVESRWSIFRMDQLCRLCNACRPDGQSAYSASRTTGRDHDACSWNFNARRVYRIFRTEAKFLRSNAGGGIRFSIASISEIVLFILNLIRPAPLAY